MESNLRKFEFTAIIAENTGAWIARGMLEAIDRKEAVNKILNEDFDDDVEWESDDIIDYLSIYQYNGDKLHICLEKIKNMSNIDEIYELIDNTLNNLSNTVTIEDITEIEND